MFFLEKHDYIARSMPFLLAVIVIVSSPFCYGQPVASSSHPHYYKGNFSAVGSDVVTITEMQRAKVQLDSQRKQMIVDEARPPNLSISQENHNEGRVDIHNLYRNQLDLFIKKVKSGKPLSAQ